MTRKSSWTHSRSLVAIALAASCALALGVVARAATQSDQSATAYTAGIVLAVDAAHGRLSLEQAGYDAVHMTMVIESDTRLQKAGSPIDLGQIHVGDPVSIEYRIGPAGRDLALSVEVLTEPQASQGSR